MKNLNLLLFIVMVLIGCSQDDDNNTQSQITLGGNYAGGIVFYIDSTGQHGLVVTSNDISTNAKWGCQGTLVDGTSKDFGFGETNTLAIVTSCAEAGTAARLCYDLSINGYSDWYLPSEDELVVMFQNIGTTTAFYSGYYWSSSEANDISARNVDPDPDVGGSAKVSQRHVRAIRKF